MLSKRTDQWNVAQLHEYRKVTNFLLGSWVFTGKTMTKVISTLSVGEGHSQSSSQSCVCGGTSDPNTRASRSCVGCQAGRHSTPACGWVCTRRTWLCLLLGRTGHWACSLIESVRGRSWLIHQGKTCSLRFKPQHYDGMDKSHIKPS